ncbi:MAG TPA: hypothetical protein VFI28_04245 [Candidatus Limnocylindrales bacterium]|nr:hypothetical protein [Candidatus Limnocylindrales bacterium]
MDTSPTPVVTVRVARSRPTARRAVVVATIAVVVAVLKPWPSAPPANPALAAVIGGPSTGPGATPSSIGPPVVRPDPSVGHDQIGCTGGGWQVVSLDRLADWTVRTWVPATPVVAAGPLDPAIPRLALDGRAVLGVGACRPIIPSGAGGPTGSVGARIVAAWTRADGAVRPLGVGVPGMVGGGRPDPRLAILYRPAQPGAKGSIAHSWPAGEFVLELAATDSADRPTDAEPGRWIAVAVSGPTGTR